MGLDWLAMCGRAVECLVEPMLGDGAVGEEDACVDDGVAAGEGDAIERILRPDADLGRGCEKFGLR